VGDEAQRGARREWPNCCATSAHDRSFQAKTKICHENGFNSISLTHDLSKAISLLDSSVQNKISQIVKMRQLKSIKNMNENS
jgi:hypothetical protein